MDKEKKIVRLNLNPKEISPRGLTALVEMTLWAIVRPVMPRMIVT